MKYLFITKGRENTPSAALKYLSIDLENFPMYTKKLKDFDFTPLFLLIIIEPVNTITKIKHPNNTFNQNKSRININPEKNSNR